MALWDLFKKKKAPKKEKEEKKEKLEKERERKKRKKKPVVMPSAKERAEKEKKEKTKEKRKKKIKKGGLYPQVLEAPSITEKSRRLGENNWYAFRVQPRANKIEVKKAVQELYGVEVEKVRIINMPGKKRRIRNVEGWKEGYKKAVVKIKEGQRIEDLFS